MVRRALFPFLSLLLLVACGDDSSVEPAPSPGGSGGSAGKGGQGGAAGKAGSAQAGSGGSPQAGAGGSPQAGAGGTGGSGGKGGSGGTSGSAGEAGKGGAGAGQSGAGQSGAGQAGAGQGGAGQGGSGQAGAGAGGAGSGQGGAGSGQGGAGASQGGAGSGQGGAGQAGSGQGGAGGCQCEATPGVTGFSECVPGKTFQVVLSSECNASCDEQGQCKVKPLEVPCPAGGEVLPTAEPYQLVLRAYMAARGVDDFKIGPDTLQVTYDAGAALSDDELHRFWLAVERQPGAFSALPRYEGLLIAPEEFLLSSLEKSEKNDTEGAVTPRAMIGRESLVDPVQNLFYASWKYPGNPFAASADAVARRAFVATAGDLMMMDQKLAKNPSFYSWDIAAGATVQYAAVASGLASHKAIDACTRAAFDVGVRRVFDRLTSAKDLGSPNADMVIANVPALLYLRKAYPDLDAAAQTTVEKLFADNCEEAGYCVHRKGHYDASYEGWSLEHLAEAALLDPPPSIATWIERFSRLKAAQSLPEPADAKGNRVFIGPSHFSNSTSAPAAQDQADYRAFARDVSLAMTSPFARYLAFGGRDGYPTHPTVDQMKSAIASKIDEANGFARRGYDCPPNEPCPDRRIATWQTRHYPGGRAAGVRLHPGGAYAALSSAPDDDRTPFALEPGDGVEVRKNGQKPFLISSRQGGLVTVVHLGNVDSDNPGAGFGGGALSAVWTEKTGSVILGWNLGMQSKTPAPFGWSTSASWPTHALRGSSGGVSFSSARLVAPDVSADAAGTSLSASGDLAGASSAALPSAVSYSRSFSLKPNLTEIKVEVSGSISVDSLEEILPLLQGVEGKAVATSVEVKTQGATSFKALAPGATSAGVVEIRLGRAGGFVRVALGAPASVALDAGLTENTGYQWKVATRGLRVALGAPGALGNRSLSYSISAE